MAREFGYGTGKMQPKNTAPTQAGGQAGYMLTPKLIEMFNNLANPQAGQYMADPREKSYNGISGFDLYTAWKNGNYSVGSENDAVWHILTTPTSRSVSSSPVASAFAGATSRASIDYVDNPITPKTVQSFIPIPEPVESTPISLFTADVKQPVDTPATIKTTEPVEQSPQQTPLESALSISNDTGVTYDSPLLTYSDRAKLFKQRMNYG